MTITAEGSGTATFLAMNGGSTALVSGAGQCRFRYNNGLNQAELSQNGGPYQPFGVGGSSITAANIATLTATPDLPLADGSIAAMLSLMCPWQLRKTGTDAVDGITIIATLSGTGRWYRLPVGSALWQHQVQWYLDEGAGNDENDGLTLLTPIKTFDEYRRRVGTMIAPGLTVYMDLLSNVTLPIVVDMEMTQSSLWIRGKRTLLYSGSVTAYQAFNYATNTEAQITDAALPVSWTASGLVNKLIEVTSGPNAGSAGYLGSDLSAKTSLIQKLLDFNLFTLIEPSVGDTFDVWDQTQVSGFVMVNCTGTVFFQDVHLNSVNWDLYTEGGQIVLLWCSSTGTVAGIRAKSWTDFYASYIGPVSVDVVDGGWATAIFGTLLSAGRIRIRNGARFDIDDETLVDGKGVGGGFIVDQSGYLLVTYPLGFVRFPAGSKPITIKASGAVAVNNQCWGSLNNAPIHWLWIDSCGMLTCKVSSPAYLHVQGATVSDVVVGSFAVSNATAYAGVNDTTRGAVCVQDMGY